MSNGFGSKIFGLGLAVAAASVLTACGGGGGGAASGGSTSSAITISGTMGGLSPVYPLSKPQLSAWSYLKNEAVALHSQLTSSSAPVHAMAACADGSFYRVLCSAWSTPPVSAYGDVDCGAGTASGSFTVSGLPKSTDITCAVRRSTDGTTYAPFATLELPSTSLTGSTDNINSTGSIVVSVTVDSATGTLTTSVTSGTNSTDTAVPTTSPTTYSGFYNMTCPSTMGATNLVRCKCMLLSDNNGGENQETCVANSAVNVTATELSINLGVYAATVGGSGLDTDGDTVADVTAGTTIYGGTIWGAQDSGGS